MPNPKLIQDYIDKYHYGEITEEAFLKRMETDADIKAEFEKYKKSIDAIDANVKQGLRLKAEELLDQHEEEEAPKNKLFSLKRVLGIAAGFALIATMVFLLQNRTQSVSTTDLFASHFEIPAPANERNATSQSEIWNEAMTAYGNQDYKRTIGLLSVTVDQADFPFTDRGKLYLGISYLMENDLENAIELLEQVGSESSYVRNAEWYTALTFLKMGDVEGAKSAFEKITSQNRHFKKAEALEILKQL